MAARTVLTPVQLVPDNGVGQGGGADVAGLVSTGVTIPPPGPFNLVLVVANSGAAPGAVTVRASRSGRDTGGNPQANSPADTVFSRSTIGDLVVSVAAGEASIIPLLDTSRFTQHDGTLAIDFADGMTGTIWAARLPYVQQG